jgi:hypothetical protein
LQDLGESGFACSFGHCLGIIKPCGKKVRIQNDGGRSHGPGKWAPTRFVHSRHKLPFSCHALSPFAFATDLPQIITSIDCTQRMPEPLHQLSHQKGDRSMSANPDSDPEVASQADVVSASRMRLPKIEQHLSILPETVNPDSMQPEDTRNPMFELLVQNESDVTGLLAYALYKQNKRDWLIAFQATHGHDPDVTETGAFILGERLPRRTATYRRLAEDMLRRGDPAGSGLLKGLMQTPANDTTSPGPSLQQAAKSPVTWRYIAIMLLMLVAMAVLFRLAGSWLFGTPRR